MRRSRGTTAVEFALLLPVFLFVTWAGFELMWVMYVRGGVQHALQEACDGAWRVTVEDDQLAGRAEDLMADMLLDVRHLRCDGDCLVGALWESTPERLVCEVEVPVPGILPWSRTGVGLLRSVAPDRWVLRTVSVRGQQ